MENRRAAWSSSLRRLGRQGSAVGPESRPYLPCLFEHQVGDILRRLASLFEEGRFQLDDPVERFIPQLANRRVLRSGALDVNDTEPAIEPITIRHLMSHSSALQSRTLGPLGMVDTGVPRARTKPAPAPARRLLRGGGVYGPFSAGTRTDDAPYPGAYLRPVARLSGGGGCASIPRPPGSETQRPIGIGFRGARRRISEGSGLRPAPAGTAGKRFLEHGGVSKLSCRCRVKLCRV